MISPEQALALKWSQTPLDKRLTLFNRLSPTEQQDLFVKYSGMKTRRTLLLQHKKYLLRCLDSHLQTCLFALLPSQEQIELLEDGFKLCQTVDPFYILPEKTQLFFFNNNLSTQFFAELEQGVRFELWFKLNESNKKILEKKCKNLIPFDFYDY